MHQRGDPFACRRDRARGVRRALVSAELALGDYPARCGARGDSRNFCSDDGLGLHAQQPHALRPRAGDRHRRGRCDRGRRGSRASHRTRHAAARGDDPRDGTSFRAGDRRGTRVERRVRALRVHQRRHGPVLPAVRADDRRLDNHLLFQLANAQPGAGGQISSRPRERDARAAAEAGDRDPAGLAVLCLADAARLCVGQRARSSALSACWGGNRHGADGAAVAHRGRGSTYRPVYRPADDRRARLAVPRVQSRLQRGHGLVHAGSGHVAPRQHGSARDIRRLVGGDVVGIRIDPQGIRASAGHGLPDDQRAIARRLGDRTHTRHYRAGAETGGQSSWNFAHALRLGYVVSE